MLPKFAVAATSYVAAADAAVVSAPSLSVSYVKIITQGVARNSENLMYKNWGWNGDKGLNNNAGLISKGIDGSAPWIVVKVRSHEFPVVLDSGAELTVLPSPYNSYNTLIYTT